MPNIQVPLNIPEVEVIKTEENEFEDFIITVKSTKKFAKCYSCSKKTDKVHGYGDTIVLKHLSLFDRNVYLHFKPTRFICDNCNKTTTEKPLWYNSRSKYTKAYEKHLMRQLVNSTVADVVIKENITEEGLLGCISRQVETNINWNEISHLTTIGIDEIALKKGHKDFVVIISLKLFDKIKILAVLPDRKKNTVKTFLNTIPDNLKRTIQSVCTDMYDGYINAVREVLGYKVNIVIDRFHVARLYRKSVDNLRKKELKRLKSELPEIEYKQLKGAMWALRKKPQNLTDIEMKVLELLFKYSPKLKESYNLSNELTKIFETNLCKKQAEGLINNWINKVTDSSLNCFDTFIKTLNNYADYILNYFFRKSRNNSGFVEGLNNKIKIIKRRCYGIFKIESLKQRIFLDLEGYEKFA